MTAPVQLEKSTAFFYVAKQNHTLCTLYINRREHYVFYSMHFKVQVSLCLLSPLQIAFFVRSTKSPSRLNLLTSKRFFESGSDDMRLISSLFTQPPTATTKTVMPICLTLTASSTVFFVSCEPPSVMTTTMFLAKLRSPAALVKPWVRSMASASQVSVRPFLYSRALTASRRPLLELYLFRSHLVRRNPYIAVISLQNGFYSCTKYAWAIIIQIKEINVMRLSLFNSCTK